VAGTFTYLGQGTLGYPSYADLETGTMLVAEPGQSYGIRAVEQGFPVPPGDGRWSASRSSARSAKSAAPPGPPPDSPAGPGYPVTVLPAHASKGGEL
jgi:hypothetical protein